MTCLLGTCPICGELVLEGEDVWITPTGGLVHAECMRVMLRGLVQATLAKREARLLLKWLEKEQEERA